MTISYKYITSTLNADATLAVEIAEAVLPPPQGDEVVIAVEAAPINPSDLALLFGPADLAAATYEPGRILAPMPEAAMRAMQGRVGEAMAVGNEGAGTVIAAGSDPYAQSLIGRRVACAPGAMYATHALAKANGCMPLPEAISAEQGAGAFVNPLTALGFVETMRRDGASALVHTAAASNLGQMLVRLCAEEGVPLVNIVRSPAQVAILKALGAQWVVDSSEPDFLDRLVEAIAATGAMLGYDAIGGGRMAATILAAMEQVASRSQPYSRYGSTTMKRVYVYGALDLSPTILPRSFGFAWNLGGWLLTPWLAGLGAEGRMKLSMRVAAGLTTTFASAYKASISLDDILHRDIALACNAKATGAKYLLVP